MAKQTAASHLFHGRLIDGTGEDEGGAKTSDIDVFKAEDEAAIENLSKAFKAGVKLVSGVETGCSLKSYVQRHARELKVFARPFGIIPLEVIHSATGAAEFLLPRWLNEIGTLEAGKLADEAGKLADIIVIDSDPTRDIALLQRPSRFGMAIKGGQPVERTVPIPEIQVWSCEKHRSFLNGKFVFDQAAGRRCIVT